MEWLFPFVVVFGIFLVFLFIGTPVFLAFTIVDIIGIYFFWGGLEGLDNFFHSAFASIANFTLLPVPLFILMGEVLARSGVFINALDTLEKFLGHIPGRLCILTIMGACIFSALSGSAMGTAAMFGALMIPEMEKRGYRMDIAIGSCSSGGLAVIIPPSALAVVVATLGDVSVGKMLISGIIPGVIMACLYIMYIIIRCTIQPEIAPPYVPSKVSWFVKISALFKNVMPFFIIVMAVTGVVFFGIATPTEAAAWGVLTSIGVTALYKRLTLAVIRDAIRDTLRITIMMFMILTGAMGFSQILNYTGISSGLNSFIKALDWPPLLIVATMQFILVIMGCFMESLPMLMTTFPVFMPIIRTLNVDPLWFCLLSLLSADVGMKTPPFGLVLFVLRGVIPSHVTTGAIYRSLAWFVFLDLVAILIVMLFPQLATFLPSIMKH